MDDKQVHQNESIKDGLEKFLDQQMFGLQDLPKAEPERQLKTEFVKPVRAAETEDGKLPQTGTDRQRADRRADADPKAYEEVHEEAYEEGYAEEYGEEYGELYEPYVTESPDKQQRERRPAGKRESGRPDRRADKRKPEGRRPDRRTDKRKPESGRGGKRKTPGGKGGKKKKPMSKAKKVLIILLLILLALFLWWYIMVDGVYRKMNYEKSDDIIEGSLKEDGVINVLLIGNDSRAADEDGRSDAMILVSISDKTGKIYMTSLLRDMYVEIPGHDPNRLNAAYAYGGPSLLCATIEQNFGIEINRYAIVNFQAFAALVDAVGGVDLDLTSEEVHWVNAYLNEYNLLEGRELTTDYLDESLSGTLHLNGPQALAYCRNRYIGTDFGRTQRQRKVLSAIAKKLPMAMATNSSEIVNGLFPNLTTNMKQTEVYGLSLNAAKYMTYDMEELTIPADGTYTNATIRKMMVLQVDFEANKKILREQIYGETED